MHVPPGSSASTSFETSDCKSFSASRPRTPTKARALRSAIAAAGVRRGVLGLEIAELAGDLVSGPLGEDRAGGLELSAERRRSHRQ